MKKGTNFGGFADSQKKTKKKKKKITMRNRQARGTGKKGGEKGNGL